MAKRGFQGAVLRAFGAHDHIATVTSTQLITPHYLRVWLHSETLFDAVEACPTAWLRFWMPDPADPEVEHQRAYTIALAEPAAGDFAVDFVLHEPAGPGSAWAQQAEPGDAVSLTSIGSSRFEVSDEPPAGYLVIGDAASIPAIRTIVATVPSEIPIELYLQLHDEADRDIPLGEHPALRVHWVPAAAPEEMAQAIEARDWSGWYAWVAPESVVLRHVRARLKKEFGFAKQSQYLQAYWVRGREMGRRR